MNDKKRRPFRYHLSLNLDWHAVVHDLRSGVAAAFLLFSPWMLIQARSNDPPMISGAVSEYHTSATANITDPDQEIHTPVIIAGTTVAYIRWLLRDTDATKRANHRPRRYALECLCSYQMYIIRPSAALVRYPDSYHLTQFPYMYRQPCCT